jgi:hypothetical protein
VFWSDTVRDNADARIYRVPRVDMIVNFGLEQFGLFESGNGSVTGKKKRPVSQWKFNLHQSE